MLINQAESAVERANVTEEADILRVENTYWAEQAISLEKLRKNPDFIKVIADGYFKDRAINIVSMLAHDYTANTGTRGQLMEELVAISRLQDHFRTLEAMGSAPVDNDEDEE
jgi:hypothetical protein